MIALIDADSIMWIIAYNNKDNGEEQVLAACDNFLRDILTLTGSDKYVGVFSDKENFRYERYNYRPYKGQRPEKPEWCIMWERTIKDHFIQKHGFVQASYMEADDVCVGGACLLNEQAAEPWVICSPDKDLRQIPGRFYDYRKQDEGVPVFEKVEPEVANHNFWMSILTGDKTDNIAGVPGLGEVKAKALLATAMDQMQYQSLVRGAFVKYFDHHYGNIIFQETHDTIMMLRPGHPYWEGHKEQIYQTINANIRYPAKAASYFDIQGQ